MQDKHCGQKLLGSTGSGPQGIQVGREVGARITLPSMSPGQGQSMKLGSIGSHGWRLFDDPVVSHQKEGKRKQLGVPPKANLCPSLKLQVHSLLVQVVTLLFSYIPNGLCQYLLGTYSDYYLE